MEGQTETAQGGIPPPPSDASNPPAVPPQQEIDNSIFRDGQEFVMPLKGEEDDNVGELKPSQHPNIPKSESFLLRYDQRSQSFLVLDALDTEMNPPAESWGEEQASAEAVLRRKMSSSQTMKSVKSLKDLAEINNNNNKSGAGFDATILRNDSMGNFGSALSYTAKMARPREMSDYGFGFYDEETHLEEGQGAFEQESQLATLERMAVICNQEADPPPAEAGGAGPGGGPPAPAPGGVQGAADPADPTAAAGEGAAGGGAGGGGGAPHAGAAGDLTACEACLRDAREQGKEVIFQARNTNIMIGTKCFYKQIKSPSREHLNMATPVNILKHTRFEARQLWFATAIGGVRIVRCPGKGQHAEYQVVAASGTRLWACWKRYRAFEHFARFLEHHNMPKTNVAWSRMQTIKKAFRCLDVPYLLMKSAYLQDFVQALLFESQDEELFMQFVQHT